jgi:hypothetical protein
VCLYKAAGLAALAPQEPRQLMDFRAALLHLAQAAVALADTKHLLLHTIAAGPVVHRATSRAVQQA